MAAPITHIVFSEKFFPKYFSAFDKKAFLVGTSFPDIRYKGVISREASHPKVSTLDDVLSEPNSFYAGQKFHAYLDLIREQYIVANGLYEISPKGSQFITQAIKFLEDKTFYDRLSNWDQVASFFEDVQPEELSFGIKEEDIKSWHSTLHDYILTPPSHESVSRFVRNISVPAETDTEINRLVDELELNPSFNEIIEGMYEGLELEGSKEGSISTNFNK